LPEASFRPNKGGVYNGALLQQKPLLLKLIGDKPKELLGKANLVGPGPEAAYGDFIRYRTLMLRPRNLMKEILSLMNSSN